MLANPSGSGFFLSKTGLSAFNNHCALAESFLKKGSERILFSSSCGIHTCCLLGSLWISILLDFARSEQVIS